MPSLLTVAVVVPTAVVVVALFLVLWRERVSSRDARVAVTSGVVLAMWAIAAIVLARDGAFEQTPGDTVPPVGVTLVVALLATPLCLGISPTLRRLLSRQASLIRLHLWRFEGIVFLVLMAQGRVPPLWALPAGIGDIQEKLRARQDMECFAVREICSSVHNVNAIVPFIHYRGRR
jgi:hypothetical protein